MNSLKNEDEIEISEPINNPENAATTIQKNWRGYQVRKGLKKINFNNEIEIITLNENIKEINSKLNSAHSIQKLKMQDKYEEKKNLLDEIGIHSTNILQQINSKSNSFEEMKKEETVKKEKACIVLNFFKIFFEIF